jgi:hypothetical protein
MSPCTIKISVIFWLRFSFMYCTVFSVFVPGSVPQCGRGVGGTAICRHEEADGTFCSNKIFSITE